LKKVGVNNYFKPLTIRNNSPLVSRMFQLLQEQRMTEKDFCNRVGVNPNTFRDWRLRVMPRVNDIEACIDHLGYEIVVRPKRCQSDT